ncbi:MAG TPA: transglycosylase SLT domain-containing protein [Bacteriovoracaceae bacterium]|nr:transglycosylase SLT domain-containing protein [Bacteriovoracaceae bacterium]
MKMAPPGSHVVRRQARISKFGIKYYVKAHIRKNRGKKIVLLPENLLYLFWHGNQNYPSLGTVKGYSEFPELDSVIQFWLDFWKNDDLKFPEDLDPFLIKTIIAIESTFRPAVRTKISGSSATGLMQITNTTRKDLSVKSEDSKYNLKDNFLDLEMTDLTDPVINIAAGIRWLSYKYTKPKTGAKKNLFNMLKGYYRWNDEGEAYAHKVLNLYNSSLTERLGRRP